MSDDLKVVVKRTIDAPVETVFDAWVDTAAVRQWFSPQGMTIPEVSMDARVGGTYKIAMRDAKGNTYTAVGAYTTVDRPKKLVFSWGWEGGFQAEPETTVTVEFSKVSDGKTEVVLTHTGFISAPSRDEHNKGWISTLEHLAEYIQK